MPETTRSIEDRRNGGVTHGQILERIDELGDKFQTLDRRFAVYEANWAPMLPIIKDLAALGRVSRILGKLIIWGGMIAAAVTAIYVAIKGVPK